MMTTLGMKSSATRLVSAMLLAGCLWAQDAPQNSTRMAAPSPPASSAAHDDSYIIGNDDVLSINVWKEPDVSRTLPVRSDGKISLPLAGEVQASGQTPHQLELAITNKLKNFIAEPEVTVIVTEIKSQNFNILGEVNKPGTYALSGAGTVLDAIALAGGFRDFAKRKSIYVLRRDANGGEQRLPFNYKDVIKGEHAEQNIKLQAHDTIVVP
jgi:polysaccharide export outer membrane protein